MKIASRVLVFDTPGVDMGLRELLGMESRDERDARWAAESHEHGSGIEARILLRDTKIAMYPVWQHGHILADADQHYRRASGCRDARKDHHNDFYKLPKGADKRKTSIMLVTSPKNMLAGHVAWIVEQLRGDGYQVDVEYHRSCGCTTLIVTVPGVPAVQARHARRV